MVSKIIRDCSGASLVEATLVFPIVMMVTFGTVDVLYMLHEWNLANKATYRGARVAVVSTPPAAAVSTPVYSSGHEGETCFDQATGAPDGAVACPTFDVTCTSATCNNAAFTAIVTAMQQVFPRIQPANVQIRYQTTGLGFSGRPGGLPMNVTVSIQCMSHQMFFLGQWAGWVVSPASDCQTFNSMPMPTFASTLPSEDIATN